MTPLDDAMKRRVEKLLANRLGVAIEEGEIENESAADACEMIVAAFDAMTYREELLALLHKLSGAWSFFAEIAALEEKNGQAIANVEDLFANRNIQLVGKSH